MCSYREIELYAQVIIIRILCIILGSNILPRISRFLDFRFIENVISLIITLFIANDNFCFKC